MHVSGVPERRQLERLQLGRPAILRGSTEQFGWAMNVSSQGVLVEIPSREPAYSRGEQVAITITLEGDASDMVSMTGLGQIVRREPTPAAWRYAIAVLGWQREWPEPDAAKKRGAASTS
jgi:hypothetical protein